MSDSLIRLQYKPDDEWLGEIFAEVAAGGFAGKASAWTGKDNLADFAMSVERYPITVEDPAILDVKYAFSADRRQTPRSIIRLTVKPYHGLGKLVVSAELTPEEHHGIDSYPSMVTAHFITNYARLGPFAKALRGLARGASYEAVLESDDTT